MSEPRSNQQIKVTAEEKVHPSIQRLARAAIALGRHELQRERLSVDTPNPGAANGDTAVSSEAAHD
ncbi:hypothetical protein [Amycolatopsis sp. CB00013]|uniref:hypothetical protein n=1 Tax=Amycolatopsis sp. CB00013 TaxID=1703945 RepID=UPI0009FAB2B7|nr:hypothetical protein [Amycolatopsis sp. CB00013]